MWQQQTMARVLILWCVLSAEHLLYRRPQSHKPRKPHEAQGLFHLPWTSDQEQGSRKERERTMQCSEGGLPARIYGSQEKKAWFQPRCFRHSSPKVYWSFSLSPLLLLPAQNSGKSPRNFLSLNNGPSFVFQCTISELFSHLYFPSLRTGTILLYSLLYLPKFFQRSNAKYVLIK